MDLRESSVWVQRSVKAQNNYNPADLNLAHEDVLHGYNQFSLPVFFWKHDELELSVY